MPAFLFALDGAFGLQLQVFVDRLDREFSGAGQDRLDAVLLQFMCHL